MYNLKEKKKGIFNKYEYSVFISYLFIQLKRILQRLKIATGKIINGHQAPQYKKYVRHTFIGMKWCGRQEQQANLQKISRSYPYP